ncbi:Initiator Replication protein [Pseudomonas peli]|uniref:Initiator Replication protein n=1 Tax=Pseudomonas peli TaxID=592361 RepID=A0AB37ZDL7_9PSED|nr:replication initiation protein [Pseudomonas peli]NMZ71367.1 replication initiation protein [Pseudomonas peli]SCW90325.1 Initiator Replication protein [Pseudomonas peli]
MADLDKNRVYQSNKLIESSHTLTLNEKRLVLCAASMIDSRKPLPKDGYVTIQVESFASVFGMETRHAYEVVRDASDRLFKRDIRRMEQGKIVEQMRWVYHVKYREGEGCVELGFSPTVLPHLTKLNREFTSYQLKQVGGLNSFYAIRFYELMSQFYKIGSRECELSRLRELLDLGDKYPSVKDLQKYVLTPAMNEVNSQTDLTVSLEARRAGRRITGFSFSIKKTDQLALSL